MRKYIEFTGKGAKQYKYLYQKMLDKDLIKRAYKKLRKGKTKRQEIIYIDAHYEEEAERMRTMILNTRPNADHPELGFYPRRKKPKYINEKGKIRRIYMPEIFEQWLHHIIIQVLSPVIMSTAYKHTYGSLPDRGAHSAKREIERWIREGQGFRYFAKMDIRHFYDSVRKDALFRELSYCIKDDWFLYVIERCLTEFKKGLPLGFYISQWLANYFLEPLDYFITEFLGLKKTIRYMDDIVLGSDNKKKLHAAIIEIKRFLGQRYRLKLKRNYQVCKFDYRGKGRPLDFVGFLFFRDRTIIRKEIMLKATRLAKRLHEKKQRGIMYYKKHISALLSYMGWFSCSDTYDCYLTRIKPYVSIKKLKQIISKLDRRTNNDQLGSRTLCHAA